MIGRKDHGGVAVASGPEEEWSAGDLAREDWLNERVW